MSRIWILFAALSLPFSACLQAQEQEQSLGDIARQVRKTKEQKNEAVPKAVLTDDSLASSKSSAAPVFGDASGGSPKSTEEVVARARASLDQADRALTLLAPMDRTTLAKVALEGRDVDFPGRRAWEEKLFATKQSYVTHGRRLLEEARQVLAEIESLSSSGETSPSSARAQDLLHRAHEVMQDAFQTEANFQAVILEGQNLAKQSSDKESRPIL